MSAGIGKATYAELYIRSHRPVNLPTRPPRTTTAVCLSPIILRFVACVTPRSTAAACLPLTVLRFYDDI